ncbi:protein MICRORCHIDIA 1-like [Phragmites australis]|uniref:protein MICRORCHIDIA 1-like n=1 Tax=Phragmites australis TaxID=29695 RepID=UPI002D78E998|nr:protein MICRORCHIDIA 1-like [Phragmites australis]XP_062201607.1 protein MICRORCHIDIA 1-like [Phragmites australis]XP_062201608.1 protein MICRORCHIDIA 1-like [Phragmites australis]XP_062201609.1 protein MICRORCHIDIA 1-like [Phragmites australis]
MPAAMAGAGGSGGRALDCRSFWKAGAYEAPAAPTRELHDALETGDFDRARVHPKFLHTNATSHKWAFGAIAELLDNAVDEICNGATFIKVDKSINLKDNSPMLIFQDDGGGMDPEGVRQCMSLGFSTKKSKTTIGQYGNGFKTSTMRLGADAIVFTRAIRGSNVTLSIGLLSYTFLRRTMKDDIVVPMLDFKIQDGNIVPLVYGSQGDWDSSLKIILDWSPFSSREELLQQFQDVDSHGTKVAIYNLWMNDDGLLELDFEDDDEDILLRDQGGASASGGFRKLQKEMVEQHISHRLRFSLRAYTSILYLRKFNNFQIILRGKPVEQISINDELKFKKVVTYKPQVAHDSHVVSVNVDVGFAKEAPVLGIFGMNVYHKNRLIMPFWKVLQEGSSRGRSVVGVLEANFIEPAHDKQDFERTPLFIRLETKLRQIIVDFWKEKCHLIGYQPVNPHLRTQYKATLKDSAGPGTRVQQKASSARNTGGLSSNLLPETYDDVAAVGLAANGSHLQSSGQAQENSMESEGLDEDLVEIGSHGVLDPNFIEKLSEENIALFSRREELRQRDTQLKQMIGDLEHELEETKMKCCQLVAELKVRKNQQHLPYM